MKFTFIDQKGYKSLGISPIPVSAGVHESFWKQPLRNTALHLGDHPLSGLVDPSHSHYLIRYGRPLDHQRQAFGEELSSVELRRDDEIAFPVDVSICFV